MNKFYSRKEGRKGMKPKRDWVGEAIYGKCCEICGEGFSRKFYSNQKRPAYETLSVYMRRKTCSKTCCCELQSNIKKGIHPEWLKPHSYKKGHIPASKGKPSGNKKKFFVCTIRGCVNDYYSTGLCQKHYIRKKTKEYPERFRKYRLNYEEKINNDPILLEKLRKKRKTEFQMLKSNDKEYKQRLLQQRKNYMLSRKKRTKRSRELYRIKKLTSVDN